MNDGVQRTGRGSEGVERFRLHVVFGPPAAGKTTYARQLAAALGACLLDSDAVSEPLVRAGMRLAGLPEEDRDSAVYKSAYREPVYETLYQVAAMNLPQVPVVIAGPFTREGGDAEWPLRLRRSLGVEPCFHFVWCPPEERRRRLMARGEPRDRPKCRDWDRYLATCRELEPVFPHRRVMTGEGREFVAGADA